MTDAEATLLIFLCGLALAGIVWGLRLEGQVSQLKKDSERLDREHQSLATKHESLDQKIMEKFSDVVEALARIEERLKSKHSQRGE